MGFIEDLQASLESVPAMLQRNYALMRDLDISLRGVQEQNEQRCDQEIEEIKRGLESGNLKPDTIRFSDEALDEQKHCVRIADEKVTLATQAYDVVDAHIQQLDQYMRKLEQIRQEKEHATGTTAGTASIGAVSSRPGKATESGRGGRKKSRLAVPEETQAVDLELPIDPNEPTYCICNQVSYGEMVACDNSNCKIEWFHFGCVGLKDQPKGKWYCPECAGNQKRWKGKRK